MARRQSNLSLQQCFQSQRDQGMMLRWPTRM
jgi:hypothetical protein